MYEKFYHLTEKPFNATPDPRFLYLGEHHQEALAHLIYGIRERKGFVAITGEVGTGKTTLIRALLERLDPRVRTALIFNPNLTLEDFFLLVFDEFELQVQTPTKAHFLMALSTFLLDRLEKNENAVLIIDEAQNLPASILEELRLLLNLETATEKLLQIVLSGQPELNHKLDLPEMRQLKQRISIRYHIPPLNREETGAYIKQRLQIAGSENPSLFTDKAIGKIYAYAKGIPRLINILGDNSLLLGYADEKRTIDHRIVTQCMKDLEPKGAQPREIPDTFSRAWWRRAGIRAWGVALLLLFLAAFFAAHLWWNREGARQNALSSLSPGMPRYESVSDGARGHSSPALTRSNKKEAPSEHPAPSASEAPPPLASLHDEPVQEAPAGVTALPKLTGAVPSADKGKEVPFPMEVVTVKANDSLSGIITKRYGKVDDEILALIRKANPQINSIDHIEVGWKIVLPTARSDGSSQ